MGNTNMAQRARSQADATANKWHAADDYKWTYTRERGPDSWWVYHPAAGGSHQSPVNIDPEEAEFDSDLATYPLKICYPDLVEKVMINTGHGCQINIRSKNCYIMGGPLSDNTYRLEQFHFHWGEDNDCGSEHTVNRKAYSAEIHFVHWNCSRYRSYEEASQNENGLAVLAVFISVASRNEVLAEMTDVLWGIQYRGKCVQLNSKFNPGWLLPHDLKKYWTYHGSLTTPPCYETVTWLIFYEPIPAASDQLDQFRSLVSFRENEQQPRDEFEGYILKNYRPVQPLGSRKVKTMEHIFTTHRDFDEQFHRQGLFTQHREYMCQLKRQGIKH